MYNGYMNGKVVICPVCKKETEVRWGIFAHDTLNRHMKEHK
jgi:hypothetical protein